MHVGKYVHDKHTSIVTPVSQQHRVDQHWLLGTNTAACNVILQRNLSTPTHSEHIPTNVAHRSIHLRGIGARIQRRLERVTWSLLTLLNLLMKHYFCYQDFSFDPGKTQEFHMFMRHAYGIYLNICTCTYKMYVRTCNTKMNCETAGKQAYMSASLSFSKNSTDW